MPDPSEPQFPPQDLPGDGIETHGAASSPAGNRPADGAPVRNPDDLASDDFAAQGGADFLGLEGGGDAAYQPESTTELASALADAPELEEGAFEEWLEDDDEDSASWLMELDEAPGEDVFDPERLEAEFGVEADSAAPTSAGWILRLTLVAAGLGAGFVGARWYGNQHAGPANDGAVARVEAPAPRTPANAKPGAATTRGGAATTATTGATNTNDTNGAGNGGTDATTNGGAANAGATSVAANGANGAATNTNTNANTGATSNPPRDVAPTNPRTTNPVTTGSGTSTNSGATNGAIAGTTTVPRAPRTNPTDSANTTNRPAPVDPNTARNGGAFTMPVQDMVVLSRNENSPVQFATADDLSTIWQGRAIPLQHVSDAQRLMTPEVGRVRLVIHGGEVFEGHLYAVGEGKVWLDTELGKMALLSWQVDRIEHLASGSGPALGEKGSEDLAGLKNVRVRTPGGVFYGKLLAEVGDEVTLITEGGGRIRLSNARVEPAGETRTRLVDPGTAGPQEAASGKRGAKNAKGEPR